MTNKRILLSVLAMAAFGVSARASVVTYCDVNCGANTIAAFNTATGNLAADTQNIFTSGNISTDSGSGLSEYLDIPTGLLFFDDNFSTLTLVGSTVQVGAFFDSGLITVPTGVTAFVVGLSAGGSAQSYVVNGTSMFLTSAPTQFGFLDLSGNIGNILISHSSGGPLVYDNFEAAGLSNQSPTPEVGTLLLIGTGLIAMRWMKRTPRPSFRTLQPQTA